ncbi:hypothetical protein Agub_g12214, partial [Astrephomene gubernaculifera]
EWLPRGSGSRGKWLVALQAWWSVGTVLEALLALWLLDRWGWRPLLAVSALPLACILAALPAIPESPHHLAASGQPEQARRVLALAAARNGTTDKLEQVLRQQQQRRAQQQQEDEERGMEQQPQLLQRRASSSSSSNGQGA